MHFTPVSEVDPISGSGCNELQMRIWEGINRAARYLHNAELRHRMRIAIRGRGQFKIDPSDPIVEPEAVELVVLFDTLSRHGKPHPGGKYGRNGTGRPVLDTNVLVMYPHLGQHHQVLATSANLHGKLIPMPVDRFQPGIRHRIPGGGRLLNSRSEGVYRIRRTGDFLDLCVGDLPNGSPAVLYRVALKVANGRRPAVIVHPNEDLVFNGQITLQHGEVLETGPVPHGEVLADVAEEIVVIQCVDKENGRPDFRRPNAPHLRLNHSVVPLAAKMNHDLLDARMLDRFDGPETFFAYSRETLVRLVSSPDFRGTGENLIKGVLSSLTKSGLRYRGRVIRLEATARISGQIASVTKDDFSTRIQFHTGAIQTVPSAAVLRIKPGDVVTCGQPLGDLLPRLGTLKWDAVSKALGSSLPEVTTEFLLAVSEPCRALPGQYLVPQCYVAGVECMASRFKKGAVRWFLDLHPIMQHFDPELNALVLPPIRYTESELCFGSITISHQQAVVNKEAERSRRYYRSQRSARSTAAVGTAVTA